MSVAAYSANADVMNWSTATYRLDELEWKFTFPCVVRLTEGFCSDNEAEGFSKDDIIGIDSKLVMHKVAAHFANRRSGRRPTKDEYDFEYERLSEEILVPLNYKGKVKVQTCSGKTYTTLRELVADFPRFAKVSRNLQAYTADDQQMDLPAGTLIELDRILPGRDSKPDVLCVKFLLSGKQTYAKVLTTERALTQCEPDETEYTIREVIDRFKLPQVVKFVDDEIRKVYTQDLVEGIENMRTITETLQLNRLVTQNVLVGHYKAVEGMEPMDTERFRKRTLVVLPLDHPDIREIEVNMLEDDGDISEIYERVFKVSNVSSSLEVVDTIYVEFFKDIPSPKMFKLDSPAPACMPDVPEEELPMPPPRSGKPDLSPGSPPDSSQAASPHTISPPEVLKKPNQQTKSKQPVRTPNKKGPKPEISPKPSSSKPVSAKRAVDLPVVAKDDGPPILPSRNPKKPPPTDKSADRSQTYYNAPPPVTPAGPDYYEIPESPKQTSLSPKSVPAQLDSPASFDIASLYSSSGDVHAAKEEKEKPHKKGIFHLTPLAHLKKPKEKSPVPPRQVIETKYPKDEEDDNEQYDEVKEEDMIDVNTGLKRGPLVSANTAVVKPMPSKDSKSTSCPSSAKLFTQLNCSELVERLNQCKMYDLAEICEKDKLDGMFFAFVTPSQLESALHLPKLDLLKLLQMRDKNWIPNV